MLDLNEVHLTGRVVRDIELRGNSNGSPFVWFSLAVNGRKNKEGELQGDFLTCQVWGKPAELLARFGKKGTRLLISKGALRSFTKVEEDGSRQSHMYVLVNGYELLDGFPKKEQASFFDSMGENINF